MERSAAGEGRAGMPAPGFPAAAGRRNNRKESARRPVSRVLSPPSHGFPWGEDRRPFVWDARYRAPLATDPGGDAKTRFVLAGKDSAAPIWSCSRWGLPCRSRCRSRGALLPHPFTLTRCFKEGTGGLLSVALSLGSPPPDVIRHRVSVEPGLSSPRKSEGRPSGRLARADCDPGWGRASSGTTIGSGAWGKEGAGRPAPSMAEPDEAGGQ